RDAAEAAAEELVAGEIDVHPGESLGEIRRVLAVPDEALSTVLELGLDGDEGVVRFAEVGCEIVRVADALVAALALIGGAAADPADAAEHERHEDAERDATLEAAAARRLDRDLVDLDTGGLGDRGDGGGRDPGRHEGLRHRGERVRR